MGCHRLAGDCGDGYRGCDGERHGLGNRGPRDDGGRDNFGIGYRGTRDDGGRDNFGIGCRGTCDNGGTRENRDNRRNGGDSRNRGYRSVVVTPACRCAPCSLWHRADFRWRPGRCAWRGSPTS